MERRREPRIQAYQKVDFILLENDAGAIDAHATQFSGRGLRLIIKQSVRVGTAVKIQGDDWLALGEVCYCQPERLNFVVGLRLKHSLLGLRELEDLSRRFTSGEREPLEELAPLNIGQQFLPQRRGGDGVGRHH